MCGMIHQNITVITINKINLLYSLLHNSVIYITRVAQCKYMYKSPLQSTSNNRKNKQHQPKLYSKFHKK